MTEIPGDYSDFTASPENAGDRFVTLTMGEVADADVQGPDYLNQLVPGADLAWFFREGEDEQSGDQAEPTPRTMLNGLHSLTEIAQSDTSEAVLAQMALNKVRPMTVGELFARHDAHSLDETLRGAVPVRARSAATDILNIVTEHAATAGGTMAALTGFLVGAKAFVRAGKDLYVELTTK